MDQVASSNSRSEMKSEVMLKKTCLKLGVQYMERDSRATSSEDHERIMLLRRRIADQRGKLLCTAKLSDRLCKKRLVRKLIRDRMLPGGAGAAAGGGGQHHPDGKQSAEGRGLLLVPDKKPASTAPIIPVTVPQRHMMHRRDTKPLSTSTSTIPSVAASTASGISMSGLDLQSLNQFNACSNLNRTRQYDQLLETALRASYLRQVELASYELASSYRRPNLMTNATTGSTPSTIPSNQSGTFSSSTSSSLSADNKIMNPPSREEFHRSMLIPSGHNSTTGTATATANTTTTTTTGSSSASKIPFYTIPHGPSKKRVKSILFHNTAGSKDASADDAPGTQRIQPSSSDGVSIREGTATSH